jgi:hypothetical protein
MWRYLLFLVVVICSGCAYQVPAINVATPNVYTTYESKIQGNYILLVDESVTNISRDVRASGHVCSAHNYPIALGNSMSASVKRLMESLFENVNTAASMPSKEAMKHDNLNGAIVVKLDTFEPRFTCQVGLFSGTCSASADIGFGVLVNGPAGRLLGFSVSGSKTADGDAGGGCEGAATVLGTAISKSEKDALERMGERISNSQALRKN